MQEEGLQLRAEGDHRAAVLQNVRRPHEQQGHEEGEEARRRRGQSDTPPLPGAVIGIMVQAIILIDALERRDLVDGNFRSATRRRRAEVSDTV